MANLEQLTTIVSTKGQVILPKPVRDQQRWDAGTRLKVVTTPDGVLLQALAAFAPTQPNDVFGCLPWHGEPKRITEMKGDSEAEGKRRHVRDR